MVQPGPRWGLSPASRLTVGPSPCPKGVSGHTFHDLRDWQAPSTPDSTRAFLTQGLPVTPHQPRGSR